MPSFNPRRLHPPPCSWANTPPLGSPPPTSAGPTPSWMERGGLSPSQSTSGPTAIPPPHPAPSPVPERPGSAKATERRCASGSFIMRFLHTVVVGTLSGIGRPGGISGNPGRRIRCERQMARRSPGSAGHFVRSDRGCERYLARWGPGCDRCGARRGSSRNRRVARWGPGAIPREGGEPPPVSGSLPDPKTSPTLEPLDLDERELRLGPTRAAPSPATDSR